ncbi:MAG: class I SAM-dependent methyltransferase [Gammaproteobacteria bacterium]|nr:class I SAM-dependent methyltransferase [Gammaproteobacteria bacterium]MDH5660736.1 class I SAM-dependent methyltransferase [Gammaproteobacteria bacterium]
MSKTNDRALNFYNKVLGLERLHYGMWLPDDELSIEKLKEAQERFENFLIENIPDNAKKILDVGCGTGILTKKLIGLGYNAEGLSPDINQKKTFKENTDAVFHHMAFEDFSKEDLYDCIIMSESSQYINVDKIFENSKRALKKDGCLMICDYFLSENSAGELGKSGHNHKIFMDKVKSSGFTVLSEKDITESVAKTLDLALDIVNKIFMAIEIGTERVQNKHPYLKKIIFWLYRKKIKKLTQQIELLDSIEFKKNKTYQFMLLQVNS